MKSSWLFISLFDVAITFIAESETNFVQPVTQSFFLVFDFKAHFYLNSHTHVVMISLQISLIKKPSSQAWRGHVLGSGGQQTDSETGVSSRQ
jgi:hypothetical protein